MGTKIATFFQTTTMIISIPSVIILTCLFLSLWGGSIRFTTPSCLRSRSCRVRPSGATGCLWASIHRPALARHLLCIAHSITVWRPRNSSGVSPRIYHWYPEKRRRGRQQEAKPGGAAPRHSLLHVMPKKNDAAARTGRDRFPMFLKDDSGQLGAQHGGGGATAESVHPQLSKTLRRQRIPHHHL